MTSLLPGQRCGWSRGIPEQLRGKCNKFPCLGKPDACFPSEKAAPHVSRRISSYHAPCSRSDWRVFAGTIDDSMGLDDSDDDRKDGNSEDKNNDKVCHVFS